MLDLQIHKEKVHEFKQPKKRFKCEKCYCVFNIEINFNTHVLECQGRKAPLMRRKWKIVNRRKKVVKKVTEFKCDLCGKDVSTTGSLNRHKAMVHNIKELPFKCEKCEKRFFSESYLKVHVTRFHENIRPFGCNLCNFRFFNQACLKSHIEKVHNRS